MSGVVRVIDNAVCPSKLSWKHSITQILKDYEFTRWRNDLKLYNLNTFRSIVLRIDLCIWWQSVKYRRSLKPACITMLRLLSGCSCLRIDTDKELKRCDRICEQCDLDEVETCYHFIMQSPFYVYEREEFVKTLDNILSVETKTMLDRLPDEITLHILLGMDYPFNNGDLFNIRLNSLLYCSNIYKRRMHVQKARRK